METFELNLTRQEIMKVVIALKNECKILIDKKQYTAASDLADLGLRICYTAEQQGW